jgi:hypothetical protein
MTQILKNNIPYFTCETYNDVENLITLIQKSKGLTTVKFKNYNVVSPFFDEILLKPKLSVDEFCTRFRKFKVVVGLKSYGVRQVEYFKLRGYSDDESKNLVSLFQQTNSKKATEISHKQKSETWKKNSKINNYNQSRGRNFYKLKGLSAEEIEEKIQKRNKKWVSSLEVAIKRDPSINKRKGKTFEELVIKHGKERALQIVRSRLCTNISKPEIQLRSRLNLTNDWISQFYISDPITGKFYIYDYVNPKTKEIIEFNGDFWHCNPLKYTSDFFHPILKLTATEIWNKDKIKKQIAEQQGYKIKYIWENEIDHTHI